ncbi:OmpP1/FadL family transporter [Spongiivirga citrea]|uniref:Transporter n=1 Tax=Spongiivirga citrea TaxID=1481457 RepID=A0A6M0CQE8_9FLAO|nr:outer membrane protein transport protein [Spongiivirga citrea]NER17727.1 transporter [Spongiivirga citrea]
MKKIFFSIIATIAISTTYAQTSSDVLRFSQENLSGTARFRAMSGAFGALGGDFSATSLNPASGAVFAHSEVAGTLGNSSKVNDATYFNSLRSTTDNNFDISQAGAVFVFKSTDDNPWRKFSVGVNLDNTNDFNNQFFAATNNATLGIDRYFNELAQGVPLDLLNLRDNETLSDLYQFLGDNEGEAAQKALLAFQGFLIDPVDDNDPDNTAYNSAALYNNLDQQYTETTRGYNRKFNFNFATQYKENLYLGINLNSHVLDYEKIRRVSEINFDEASTVKEVTYEDSVFTSGTGFSLQVGAIAKVGPSLRLGASYQSPTWYRLQDETREQLTVFRTDPANASNEIQENLRPRVINLFEQYRVNTPAKLTGSIAYVFDKYGLLSFDYGRKDFGSASLRPTSDPAFQAENTAISNQFQVVNSYRIGGEIRLEEWSIRGGYHFEDSPFANEAIASDKTGFSAGLGYRFGGTRVDVSYDRTQQEFAQQLFPIGLTSVANVDNTISNINLTISWKL